ncbi:hypothetical protein GCM10023185_42090 [Hymenobacter saemangeumensis]|uniref:Rax2-like C-terminal domain-containing protein n=1 Tax=Hymenobacter saemangeumensis TaxID=1084522 RepID=A0ABP8IRM4_9BACT
MLLTLLFASPVWAGSSPANEPGSGPIPSLAEALNPDGTLRAGASGSFNPKGYRMATAPDGKPMFRPAGVTGAGDENWDDRFGFPGTNADGQVLAMVVSGTDVYIGGIFNRVSDVLVNKVAKWNGRSWSALGEGVNGTVRALALSGGDLYVGGNFSTAGGSPASNIAKWNGSIWSAMGSGMNSSVRALAVIGSEVYAGGDFNSAGGVNASFIAKWNGSAWSRLGAGFNGGSVYALVVSGSDVYLGGDFGTTKWNGSTFSTLGAGPSSGVRALAVSGGELYAAGSFTMAGSVAANRIAKWNGSTWSALGAGLDSNVSALAVSGSDVYVGGQFTSAGGVMTSRVAKWDGSAWSALGAGINPDFIVSTSVSALAVSGGIVYAGGLFINAGDDVQANNIAQWSSSSWKTMGKGIGDVSFGGTVHAVAVNGNEVYVGGQFNRVAGVRINNIAKWDGSDWSPLGTGTQGTVWALAMFRGELYATGSIGTIGGVATSGIVKWNGSNWSGVGPVHTTNQRQGVDGNVYALAVNGGGPLRGRRLLICLQ